MRLLSLRTTDGFELTSFSDDKVPPYAILSHTWIEGEEVTYAELIAGSSRNKTGYDKLRFCGQRAAQDSLRYFWVDTCCIDKSNSNELSAAINSMFRWYQRASKCYVFLSDVSVPADVPDPQVYRIIWENAFQSSRWFTRGWTLQELIAPASVEFFCNEGKRLGSKVSLEQEINQITQIPVSVLRGQRLSEVGIEERTSWAAKRITTVEEDKAYCLLGIFGIFLPLIYGEGEKHALMRLKEEVQKRQTVHGTQSLQDLSAASKVYYIPFLKNRYFVGRRNELTELKQKLIVDQECQKMSIVGLGGTGKTQVALQFAYMVKETRPEFSIFWLPAVSMESFEQACTEVAKALGIPQTTGEKEDVKELVKRHLSAVGTGQRWLLVLDNADDRDIVLGTAQSKGIVDYLPESEQGMTVYTTRTQEMAESLTRSDVIELGPMDQQDAEDFLERSLVKKSLLDDSAAIAELLDELTYLPLAIRQATAYLNMNKTSSIAKYLRLLRNTEQDLVGLMSKEFRDETRYKDSGNAVATTWVVSFRQIRERDPAAADLLAFMSCIEWKAIPRSLLPSAQSEGRIEEAIGMLCGYSFLASRQRAGYEEEDGEEEWYDMHRLVHLATRIWTTKHENGTEAIEKALQHVIEVFPSDDYTNRAVWRAYIPHALRVLQSMQSRNLAIKAQLSLLVGRCLRVDGRVREAVAWLEECHRWRRDKLEEDDPDRLLSEHVLAMAYEADGQVKKAVALLEQVVAVEGKVLAEDHPDRLASQHALAGAYQADGQVKKAVALLEQVVAVQEKLLAEDHPSQLASQHALAGAYRADRQVKKAVALLEQVVAVKEKLLAEDHPDRLASQHELAGAYQADGQVKKAVALLEQVVAVREKLLAEDHPDRLASQHELAGAY